MSEICDQLWVVIDRFTKIAHFIPLREKTVGDLAIIFAREVWKHHMSRSCPDYSVLLDR